MFSNGIEKSGGDLTCKGKVPKSRGTAEQGCAEAKLGKVGLWQSRVRMSMDELRIRAVWKGKVLYRNGN